MTIDWKSYGRVLVLIDTANLSKGAETAGKRVNYRNLARFFRRNAAALRQVVYIADFGTPGHAAFLGALKRYGFQVVAKPVKLIAPSRVAAEQKANFDVEITLNAMEWLDEYDTLVLFSGDSDFTALVRTLQARGKRVTVCAFQHTVAREMRAVADLYVDVFRLGEGILDWGN
ncbi:MAG: NYN domain-containing protein [Chloroflexi bacterium]|nr:NYN domain-containing protein [Chloroflexota bacterium]